LNRKKKKKKKKKKMNKNFIRRAIRSEIPKKEWTVRIPAVMGDGNGNIGVAGKPGYVYVRFGNGQPWVVFNASSAPKIDVYKI